MVLGTNANNWCGQEVGIGGMIVKKSTWPRYKNIGCEIKVPINNLSSVHSFKYNIQFPNVGIADRSGSQHLMSQGKHPSIFKLRYVPNKVRIPH